MSELRYDPFLLPTQPFCPTFSQRVTMVFSQTSDSKATYLICFNSLTNTQNLSHGCDEEKERKHLGNLFQHLANRCVCLPDIQQYAPANFLMHLLPLLHQGLTLTGPWCNEHQEELLAEPVL
ncbi:hypothetical protein XENOCAPTIV_003158 [Xenoophorus captivus]|uniref:Uncharacterized protein n=1 Tax=Xenoophorus captivus TaxID=1517983 RepID=A0ABV0S7B9_9TELE